MSENYSQNSQKGNTAIICLSPYSGGMEMDAIKLARLLSPQIEIVLIAKSDHYIANYYQRHMQSNKITLETIAFSSAFSLSIIFKARNILKKHHIRNVIFFGASEMRSLYFAFLGRELNVLVRHGTTKTRPKKDWLHRLIYSCVDFHIAICQHLADNVKYIIPMAADTQLKVIYPSLRQAPQIEQATKNSEIVNLLHVGRVADGKGQKEAVEACDVLAANNISFELTLVGEIDASYEESFKRFVESKSYAPSVNIIGYTDNVAHFYKQAQIFIFPSKGEGLSNAFIEALSYGLCCISFNNTSFPELRELGLSFYMARDQDIGDLQSKLLAAVQDFKLKKFPLLEQSKLTTKIFSANREKHEYLELLQ